MLSGRKELPTNKSSCRGELRHHLQKLIELQSAALILPLRSTSMQTQAHMTQNPLWNSISGYAFYIYIYHYYYYYYYYYYYSMIIITIIIIIIIIIY